MDIKALLNIIAPHLAGMSEDVIDSAVQLAESRRPKCLSEDRQREAVALYAAYLLTAKVEAEINPYGLTSEREGDLSRSFGGSKLKNSAADYLERYNALNDICRTLGSITVGSNYVG